MITETQDLILKLIEKSSFNHFSGPDVVKDLRANKDFWRSDLMTRFVRPIYRKLENPIESPLPAVAIYHKADLLPLKSLPNDAYTADTLLIHSEPGRQEYLEMLATRWKADECYWVLGDEAFRGMGRAMRMVKDFTGEDRVLLVLWWD